jgi:HlyD family secretion protein
LTGALEAERSEKVHVPRTPLWQLTIRWMEVDGTTVVEGQRVLEMDNSQFTSDLVQKRLARSGAYNDLIRKEADIAGEIFDKEFALEQQRIAVAKARIDAEIPATLRSSRDYQEDQLDLARAEFEYDKALEELEASTQASVAAIEELDLALRRAEGEIATAEDAIAKLTLAAPRDGILVVAENPGEGRKFQEGDNAWVGLAVMSIPDLSSMMVVARLSDVDDGRIAPGMPAVCTLDAYPDRTFTGHVREIAPIAQEDSNQSMRRSFRVVIVLDEPDPERMRPGMSVRVEITETPADDVLIAPRVALDLSSEPYHALLADGSTAEIRLGRCSTVACVIEEGLDEGARLRRRR